MPNQPSFHPNILADRSASVKVLPGGFPYVTDANCLIHFHAQGVYVPEHDGLLSVKWARGGQEVYETGRQRFVVDDSSYLVLNRRQSYSSHIPSGPSVESFCAFMMPGFAEKVLAARLTPEDHLLDMPNGDGQPVVFFDHLYPHDSVLTPLLEQTRARVLSAPVTPGWLEERFHAMVLALLQVHRGIGRDIGQMPAARRATRVELYRRLHRAKDYIDSNLTEALTLDRIAAEAWFSPYHFLRAFKSAFGETPHQYLTRRRMERARLLVTRTDAPVTSICTQVGFQSLGSFSWLYRKRFGLSPEQMRRQEAALRPVYSLRPPSTTA